MPPKKAHFGNRGSIAKVAKEKLPVAKAGAMTTTATIVTMAAAMDHDRTGGIANTTTGVATAPPRTMVDVMADGALAPMAHPRRIQGTVIILSHR